MNKSAVLGVLIDSKNTYIKMDTNKDIKTIMKSISRNIRKTKREKPCNAVWFNVVVYDAELQTTKHIRRCVYLNTDANNVNTVCFQ